MSRRPNLCWQAVKGCCPYLKILSCWDCDDSYMGKTKCQLHDRKTEHFKALMSNSHSSAIADHTCMTQTGHRIKWDNFDILATGQSDIHCKIRETLFFDQCIGSC